MSITARGGYQIVDFKKIEVPMEEANAAPLADGLLEQIKNCEGKPTIIYNLVLRYNPSRVNEYLPFTPLPGCISYNAEYGAEIIVDDMSIVIKIDGSGYFVAM